jgi:hypothetical protein
MVWIQELWCCLQLSLAIFISMKCGNRPSLLQFVCNFLEFLRMLYHTTVPFSLCPRPMARRCRRAVNIILLYTTVVLKQEGGWVTASHAETKLQGRDEAKSSLEHDTTCISSDSEQIGNTVHKSAFLNLFLEVKTKSLVCLCKIWPLDPMPSNFKISQYTQRRGEQFHGSDALLLTKRCWGPQNCSGRRDKEENQNSRVENQTTAVQLAASVSGQWWRVNFWK